MNRILITGGTGSLGQEITKHLLASESCDIIIYSRDEQKQEQMANKFNNKERLRFFIGDVRDKERLQLALWGVTHVIHAAALKIVPSVEYNPMECLKTNILGTQNLIDGIYNTHDNITKKILFISTDKAVAPYNLYGASKTCAEKLIIAANNINRGHCFSAVRWGNVACSRGSVIPLFQKQVANGNKITVTSREMTRFWITLEEAAKFALDCFGHMYISGGDIFIPNLDGFKIIDLATIFCDKYKLIYDENIEIIGKRPGEKEHEVLISHDEKDNWWYSKEFDFYMLPTKCPNLNFTKITEPNLYDCNSSTLLISKQELANRLTKLGVI